MPEKVSITPFPMVHPIVRSQRSYKQMCDSADSATGVIHTLPPVEKSFVCLFLTFMNGELGT